MDSMTFIEGSGKATLLPLYVLYGDEPFLKRQVMKLLRLLVLGPESDDAGMSVHAGDGAVFAAVYDELQTVPLFSPRRLVVVEDADPFVTQFRATLEKKVKELPATGVLVLDVKKWQSNTRLFKLVGEEAAVNCNALTAQRLPQWCIQWARTQHHKELAGPAAALLVDLIGAEMGLLDQELEKLATYVGTRPRIDSGDVDKLVGHSRTEDVFKILEAIAAGRSGEALTKLDRLFEHGEPALKILGAFGWQLRKLAQAARLARQGKNLRAALEQAGVPPFALQGAEQQLRHLGRARANRLYDWLLEVNVGLKGGSPLPERTQLERFLLKLA
jgi:DNA polymerase-3 subunit delta